MKLNKINKKSIFYIIPLLWLFIVGSFILSKEYILDQGTEILLRVEPVDPRDLFRGDYVTLRYPDISNVERAKLPVSAETKKLVLVYARLRIDSGNVASLDRVSLRPFDDDQPYVKGQLKVNSDGSGSIMYDFESFFVPEEEGKRIENHIGEGNVLAKVVISKGNAVLKSLIVNGEEVL